ncbi:MAG: FAD-dependent oxidoreductase [Pseudomonadota bacterium]|nr:FAD-dependent oxidoreductase [Pseudomonadota bacterium]
MKSLKISKDSLITEPYWSLETPKFSNKLEDFSDSLDLLIIGAGYTGLSAALAAEGIGAKVGLVDAHEAGSGASTRNGGMVGAHPKLSWKVLERKFGQSTADGVFEEASWALSFLKKLIQNEKIECDFEECGRIQLAWSKNDFERQKQLACIIKKKSDVKVKIVCRNELRNEIVTERYFGGLLFPEHCSIDPAKFHLGLLKAVLRRKIPLIENCPVHAVKRNTKGFKVYFQNKEIFVKRVLMATNGYTLNDFPWFKKRVFPLPSYIVATEDIAPEILEKIAPGRRMMVETRAKHAYFRISPNGRKIIFGGRAAMTALPLDIAAGRLKTLLDDIWPDIRDFQITHCWTGNTGFAFNQVPHIGINNGIHYAIGFSGSGTVLAPYLGAKAALSALNHSSGKTAYSKTFLRKSVVHFLNKPYFLNLSDLYYRFIVDPLQFRQKK